LQSIHRQEEALHKISAPSAHLSSVPPLESSWYTPVTVTANCPELPASTTEALAKRAGEREGLDPQLILAVMKQESDFRPCAVSPKGALGLMQLMPETADDLDVLDPMDPEQNVAGGARFLRQLLDRYVNDPALALSAYNAGPARVTDQIPDIPETKAYVSAILSRMLPMLSISGH